MGSATFGPAPVMLVGNKCDRVTEREVSTQEGSALAKQLNCDFVEASAKNCVNVEKAFYDVVRQLRKQRASAPQRHGTGMRDGGKDYSRRDRHHNHSRYDDDRTTRRYRRRDRESKASKCVIL